VLTEVREPAAEATGRRPTVLVVEDNEAVARVLRFCLRQAGFDATEVAAGREALRILSDQPPDAVVLDLQLPDDQGGAVLDWLRHRAMQGLDSPVWVVMSALEVETARQRFGPLGDHFVSKPFDPWDIVKVLRTLLATKN
jgi:two-component system phosphate regulon response regulator PhoB